MDVSTNAHGRVVISSRSFSVLVFSAILLSPATNLWAEESISLISRIEKGDLSRVKVVLEVGGQVKLNPDGKKVVSMPIDLSGTLLYDEKVLSTQSSLDNPAARVPLRTIRYYHECKIDFRHQKSVKSPGLRDNRRIILVETEAKRATIFSPQGPLSREELEMLEIQGNTALLDWLLPEKEIRSGESWQHEEEVLLGLLGLDAISDSQVKSTLVEIQQDVAKIELTGTVSGAVEGTSTEIELNAKYHFHRSQKRITWLTMSIKEKRSIGHSTPGLDVTARLRVLVEPIVESVPLEDKSLGNLVSSSTEGVKLLNFDNTSGSFQLLHDRHWRVMADRQEVTILRMVKAGELIAQCNISPLPKLASGKQLSLQEFQGKIEKALGNNFGQLVDSTEATREGGLKILRVIAAGEVEQLPIQWTYYHVSDKSGHRAAFVFTLESKLAKRFAAADQALVGNFHFLEKVENSSQSVPEKKLSLRAATRPASAQTSPKLRRK